MPAVKSAPYLIINKRRPRTPSIYNVRRQCPLCKVAAIVPLTPSELAEQHDGTTHACHPMLGGCGHGAKLTGSR